VRVSPMCACVAMHFPCLHTLSLSLSLSHTHTHTLSLTHTHSLSLSQAGRMIAMAYMVGVCLLWTFSYVFRVGTKDMTYSKQLKVFFLTFHPRFTRFLLT